MTLLREILNALFALPPDPWQRHQEKLARLDKERRERRRKLVAAFTRGSVTLGRGRYITEDDVRSRLTALGQS